VTTEQKAAIVDALNSAYRLGGYAARLAVDDTAGRRQIAEGLTYVEARLVELLESAGGRGGKCQICGRDGLAFDEMAAGEPICLDCF
jgi:hypothetical protein